MRKALVLFTTAALVAGSALGGPAVARDRLDRVELSANQITDQYAARTARIKADLHLTPEQAKNWPGFESAMNDLAKASADRQMAMQTTGTPPKGPVDIIEQMRQQAKYLSERSVERKTLADAAEPLYASLDDQQKRRFAAELMNLSRPDAD
jgi:L-serine deaminase